MDTDVVRVLATSKDIGVNADITYSIIGGNEHRKFKMDSKTGLVSVAKEVDHEHAKEYFLTIQARDGGVPPLSNHATVNITVMDANDNPPRFSHLSYSALVNEASPVKSSVVTVTATDIDEVRPSSQREKLPNQEQLCTNAGRQVCKPICKENMFVIIVVIVTVVINISSLYFIIINQALFA